MRKRRSNTRVQETANKKPGIEYRKHFRRGYMDDAGLVSDFVRSQQVSVKFTPYLMDAIKRLAARANLCRATLIASIVECWLVEKGFLSEEWVSTPRTRARIMRLVREASEATKGLKDS